MLHAIIDILENNNAVTAQVPADNMHIEFRQQEQALPSLVVEIDGSNPTECKGHTSVLDKATIVVTVFAEKYGEAWTAQSMVRAALDSYSGNVLGVSIAQCRWLTELSNYYDLPEGVHSITHQYEVSVKRDGDAYEQVPGEPTFCERLADCTEFTDLVERVEVLEQNGGNGGGGPHTHSISDVTGLQTALDGKAAGSHSHAISDVTGLQTALDGKAASSHSHAISDVTGLQTALDGKAASSHSHAISDTTGLQAALDGKAASSHTHSISNVTGLQAALDGKAASSHTHSISNVTGLQTALDGKAASSHSHVINDVTGLQTALDGKVGFIEIIGGTSSTNATGTRISHPGVKQASGSTFSGQIYRVRTARTLSEINAYIISAMPADGTFTITVQKNNVDTSMTVQFAASDPLYTVKSTTSNPVSFAAGDYYTLKIVKVGATAAPSFEIISGFTI